MAYVDFMRMMMSQILLLGSRGSTILDKQTLDLKILKCLLSICLVI